MHRFSALFSIVVLLAGCGASSAPTTTTTAAAPAPRPGPPVDLLALVPADAVVVLHADLGSVRQDPARYQQLADGLATELGLSAESATLRALLDRTDQAVGVFVPGANGQQEGMLLFDGRYSDQDFEQALSIASARHPGQPTTTTGGDGRRVIELGNATLVQLDTWTWAVIDGPTLRAHITSASLRGPRTFARDLLEFGPRIGLPQGSTQAWADQNSPVGVDMVGLVFQGQAPDMVRNFVSTVRRHLAL